MRLRSGPRATATRIEELPQNQRLHYRQKLRNLAYVSLGSGKAGILRDISEDGIAVQVLAPLRQGEEVRFGFDLPNPRLRFEAGTRVAWTDSLGQAGLEFVELAPQTRRLLKEWLFSHILADAHRTLGEPSEDLLFSKGARPAIRLVTNDRRTTKRVVYDPDSASIPLMWFSVSPLQFSRCVDAMALSCAVLLFSLMTAFLIDVVPAWWVGVLFFLAATSVFGLLYWALFALWFGTTPGNRLAELACSEAGRTLQRAGVVRPRFR